MPKGKKKTAAAAQPRTMTTREQLEQRRDEQGRVVIDDLIEASILAMFVVQKLGKASVDEIREKIEAIAGVIDPHLAQQACEALQARGLVSYARGRLPDSGESVVMWRPRQIVWAAPPEVAHITELLPALVATEEAQELVTMLNAGEEEGEGEKKSKSKMVYDEYYSVEAEFVTLDELLGSQPASPRLDWLHKRSAYNGVEAQLRFWRDERDGALLLAADCVRGWLRTGLRAAGYSDAIAQYLAVSPARIIPKRPIIQSALPLVDASGGKGLPTYETLQPGEHFTVQFRLPRRGFMTSDQFKLFLAGYGPNPIRGISPARGARFGAVALVGYRVLGELRSARVLLESVLVDALPEEARDYYNAMLEEVRANDVDLRRGAKGKEAQK